jgi:hypothetical protein
MWLDCRSRLKLGTGGLSRDAVDVDADGSVLGFVSPSALIEQPCNQKSERSTLRSPLAKPSNAFPRAARMPFVIAICNEATSATVMENAAAAGRHHHNADIISITNCGWSSRKRLRVDAKWQRCRWLIANGAVKLELFRPIAVVGSVCAGDGLTRV